MNPNELNNLAVACRTCAPCRTIFASHEDVDVLSCRMNVAIPFLSRTIPQRAPWQTNENYQLFRFRFGELWVVTYIDGVSDNHRHIRDQLNNITLRILKKVVAVGTVLAPSDYERIPQFPWIEVVFRVCIENILPNILTRYWRDGSLVAPEGVKAGTEISILNLFEASAQVLEDLASPNPIIGQLFKKSPNSEYADREQLLRLRRLAEEKHGNKYQYAKFWEDDVPQELKDSLRPDIRSLMDRHSDDAPQAAKRLIKAERERQNGQI